MELSYYETRLLYDTMTNLLPHDSKSDSIESYHDREQLLGNSSASISKLLFDLAYLFDGDIREGLHGEKEKFDLLEFADTQLHRSRDEIIRCNQTMLTLSEKLQTLNSMTVKFLASAIALTDSTDTIVSNSSANIRSNALWLKGAEEKIKMHAFQVMKETYLENDNSITQLRLETRRLSSRRTAQSEEKNQVRG